MSLFPVEDTVRKNVHENQPRAAMLESGLSGLRVIDRHTSSWLTHWRPGAYWEALPSPASLLDSISVSPTDSESQNDDFLQSNQQFDLPIQAQTKPAIPSWSGFKGDLMTFIAFHMKPRKQRQPHILPIKIFIILD